MDSACPVDPAKLTNPVLFDVAQEDDVKLGSTVVGATVYGVPAIVAVPKLC
jgi:hypothetical protein